MNQKALSFFFANYDFKNFEATNADEGFIENHINSLYTPDEQPVMRLVRRTVRELSAHPALATDFVFDAGSHQGMYRRLEGYRVNVDEQLVMKITIEMGEDAGTYVAAKVIYPKLEKAAKREFGKRWQKAAGVDFDYAAAFSQMRNLASQLSNSCVFKVDENGVGFTLTIMPLTKGLVDFAKGQEAAAGTFVKIQLRNAA
jgi:hypothetical protein